MYVHWQIWFCLFVATFYFTINICSMLVVLLWCSIYQLLSAKTTFTFTQWSLNFVHVTFNILLSDVTHMILLIHDTTLKSYTSQFTPISHDSHYTTFAFVTCTSYNSYYIQLWLHITVTLFIHVLFTHFTTLSSYNSHLIQFSHFTRFFFYVTAQYACHYLIPWQGVI